MILLIDGNNWVSREFYLGPAFMEECRAILRVFESTHSFDRIIIGFDGTNPWRLQQYKPYKAGSRERPGHYYRALDQLNSEWTDEGYEVIQLEEYEAEDIVASEANKWSLQGVKVVMASSDKSLYECLRPGLVTQAIGFGRKQIDGKTGYQFRYMTAEGLKKAREVTPSQWLDYRAICGDTHLNIPGCPGVGPDGASKLLHHCGSLDLFYAVPANCNLNAKRYAAMMNHREKILRYRDLMALSNECTFD